MSGLPDLSDAAAVALWNRAASGFLRDTLDRIMMSSASTATPAQHAFERRVDEVKCPKSAINFLIYDYLIKNGYYEAAAKFCVEANLPPLEDKAAIQARKDIKMCILNGDIQTAIEMLNEFDPEILDEDKALHFSLLRLQLIELIRTCNKDDGDISPALTFATEQLGPRAPTNPKFLEDLEMTMALLLFPQESLEPQLAALLDTGLRAQVADSVNKAILGAEPALHKVLRTRAWSEVRARDKGADLPSRLDIGLKREDADGHGRQQPSAENGHDSMMMA